MTTLPPQPPTQPASALENASWAWDRLGKNKRAEARAALALMGRAPGALGRGMDSFCQSIGAKLASMGMLAEIESLAGRGWGPALFPAPQWPAAFEDILGRGAAGWRTMQALAASGVELHAFDASQPGGQGGNALLAHAASRADAVQFAGLLANLRASDPEPSQIDSALADSARVCLPDPDLAEFIAPFILAEPAAWARARREPFPGDKFGRLISPMALALELGRMDLARAMIQADAAGALSCVDLARCHLFERPMEAMELLLEFGADPLAANAHGDTALHGAAFSSDGLELCAKLVAMGADPMARDRDGSTPIGRAAHLWIWAELVEVLGAAPADLMESIHMHGMANFADPGEPAPLRAVQYWADAEVPSKAALEAADARMSTILEAAFQDPRSLDPSPAPDRHGFIEGCLNASAAGGMPSCLRASIAALRRVGRALDPGLFAGCLRADSSSAPWQDMRHQGRLECLRAAAGLGVDLDVAIAQGGRTETLAEMSARMLVEMSWMGHRGHESIAIVLLTLAGMGCLPTRARGSNGQWSFDPAGPGGRAQLAEGALQGFEAVDALLEAKALRTILGAAPAKAAGLRI